MISFLTTGQCADILNDLAGLRVYSSDFILSQVREGHLVAKVYEKGTRQRVLVRITPLDFRTYIAQHYPQYLDALDRRCTLNSQIAS